MAHNFASVALWCLLTTVWESAPWDAAQSDQQQQAQLRLKSSLTTTSSLIASSVRPG